MAAPCPVFEEEEDDEARVDMENGGTLISEGRRLISKAGALTGVDSDSRNCTNSSEKDCDGRGVHVFKFANF